MSIVSKFARDVLTEDVAGETFCYIRALSVLAGIALVGLMIYTGIIYPMNFNIEQCGRAFAEYFAGVAVAIWGKEKSGA